MYQKNIKRLENFDDILRRIHNRIKYNARLEKTYCFFQIPEFIIGVPLYNINDLKKYIINALEKDGFKLMYLDPNWLFISWEINKSETRKINSIRKESKKKDGYRLIDEYKPRGGFTNDLTAMKDKAKYLV